MPTLFLVLHGSSDGGRERLLGRTDLGLNKQGRLEAGRAADACRRLGVGLVASSPTRRARETAEIIAESVECRLEIVDAFDEVDFGRWSGKLFSELVADPEWRRFNDDGADVDIPEGEGLDAVILRIKNGLEHVCPRDDSGEVVIVTHAEIIRGAMQLAESRPGSSSSIYQPEPGGITPVRWSRSAAGEVVSAFP
jgi:probable phosphoglycerate mutase